MARPEASEERISQIIEAALAVFAREGFAQARIEDIAKEAGLAKGTVYLYFKSKDAIIAAILKVLFRQELRLLRPHAAAQGPISPQLLELARHMAGSLSRMKPFLPIMFEFYAIAGRRQDVREFLFDAFADYRTTLATLIQRGIEQGEFRAVDPSGVAITFMALFEGLILFWAVNPQEFDWQAQAEASVQQLLAGIQVRDV